MIKRKNWVKLCILLIISIGVAFALFKTSVIDINQIDKLGMDFQYNAISMSAIIGGFLFTGISILISTIDKERIKRLWDNNYLDNLYRAAFIGMIANVITIIAAFLLLCGHANDCFKKYLVYIEITSLTVGLIFFVWCIRHLIFIMTKLKGK